jgi:hypothetical protein
MPARNIVVVCSGSHEKKANLGEVLRLGQGAQGFGRTAAAGPEGGQVFPQRLLGAVGALAVGLKRRTLDQQESDLPGCFVGRAGLRIFEQFGQGDCEEAPQRSGFIVRQRIHQIGHECCLKSTLGWVIPDAPKPRSKCL